MEWLSVGLAIIGAALVVVGYYKKSEDQDFFVRIVVLGVYCFIVALTAAVVVECERNGKLAARISALEAQLAAKQQPAVQNTTAEQK